LSCCRITLFHLVCIRLVFFFLAPRPQELCCDQAVFFTEYGLVPCPLEDLTFPRLFPLFVSPSSSVFSSVMPFFPFGLDKVLVILRRARFPAPFFFRVEFLSSPPLVVFPLTSSSFLIWFVFLVRSRTMALLFKRRSFPTCPRV